MSKKPSGLCVFTMCSHDDTPVLPNLLRSLAGLRMDRVIVYDTGPSHLSRNPLPNPPSIAATVAPFYGTLPIVVVHKEFTKPIDISTFLNEVDESLGRQYAWVMRPDTDEVLTHELVSQINHFLVAPPANVATVTWRWLTLCNDEQHYSSGLTGELVHGRLYRPLKIRWSNKIHEHQTFSGEKVVLNGYMLHCRQLFRKRCLRQTGFPPESWHGFAETCQPMTALDTAATWDELVWPVEERDGRD